MTTHGRLVSVALVLALATVSSALAQPSQDVQGRLERSSKLQKEALANLGDPARAEVLVRTAHRELKAAHNAMLIKASASKFPDPLIDLNSEKAAEALSLLAKAGDALRSNRQALSPQPYLDEVRSSLEQAFRLTSLVFAF
jgi:hypothetical protein